MLPIKYLHLVLFLQMKLMVFQRRISINSSYFPSFRSRLHHASQLIEVFQKFANFSAHHHLIIQKRSINEMYEYDFHSLEFKDFIIRRTDSYTYRLQICAVADRPMTRRCIFEYCLLNTIYL